MVLSFTSGIFSLIFFGLCSNYSGILLGRVRNRYYPHATSYSDLAREIVGPKFGKFTRIAILVNWASILVSGCSMILCLSSKLQHSLLARFR